MLYIVATPIGNLKDITFRVVEILKSVDYILCEDTRMAKRLLAHYQISDKRLISYHQHSQEKKIVYLLALIRHYQVALVTDAGTPGISDPGNKIIARLVEADTETQIVPIPGPSAVVTALSISGLPTDKFLFLGFPPHKKGRNKFFDQVMASRLTVVFYESCHRIVKALEQLEHLDTKQLKRVVVGRELTKKFETIYRGNFKDILQQVASDPVKGEYVVVVA